MPFLIYGAYGYTGALIAREAKRRGLAPTLAGRDARKLRALAGELDLPSRAFSLDDRPALDEATREADLVLHCAGPFTRTVRPMVEACIGGKAHYLDITGEIEVFEYAAAQGCRAAAEGVMLMPGVGFDVVPTDCLAAHLKQRQPDAQYLELAIFGIGSVSRGTALTQVEYLGKGGAIRRDGEITRVPAAWRTRRVDFGRGHTEVVSIPWGDVATAYHTTGIPTVVAYAKLPPAAARALEASRYLGGLLSTSLAKKALGALVRQQPAGPNEQARRQGRSFVWGKATAANGASAKARLAGPETYALTVQTALAAAGRVLDGDAAPGFQTPGAHFGPDFILGIDGTRREDLS